MHLFKVAVYAVCSEAYPLQTQNQQGPAQKFLCNIKEFGDYISIRLTVNTLLNIYVSLLVFYSLP